MERGEEGGFETRPYRGLMFGEGSPPSLRQAQDRLNLPPSRGKRKEGTHPSHAPPWVPAFAGMTKPRTQPPARSFDKLRMSGWEGELGGRWVCFR